MKARRRQLGLVIALIASAYLLGSAALMLPGATALVWLLAAAAVAIQLGLTAALIAREALRRRYVVLGGLAEVAIGFFIFWQATILHGRFAPPGQELLPLWARWGAAGAALAGVAMIVAALIHARTNRSPQNTPPNSAGSQ